MYGFNVNSQVVLFFVRDALLGEWVWLGGVAIRVLGSYNSYYTRERTCTGAYS